MTGVKVRRVYEEPVEDEGVRVLVDRLWPRGMAKKDLVHDRWMKEVAPSTELRKWYGHEPERFDEFRSRYRRELASEPRAELVSELRGLAGRRDGLTLLTATKNVEGSAAVVLADVIRRSRD